MNLINNMNYEEEKIFHYLFLSRKKKFDECQYKVGHWLNSPLRSCHQSLPLFLSTWMGNMGMTSYYPVGMYIQRVSLSL